MHLTVVTGPPCSGKTTHVDQHRHPDDLVIDLDRLAHAMGYPDPHIDWAEHATNHPARDAARIARQAIVDAARTGKLAGRTAWLIETQLHPISRRIYQRAGADIVHLDPGPEVCHDRADAAGRTPATHDQIDHWYATSNT